MTGTASPITSGAGFQPGPVRWKRLSANQAQVERLHAPVRQLEPDRRRFDVPSEPAELRVQLKVISAVTPMPKTLPLGRPITTWLHIARNRPWLEAFTSSTMLERRNNGEIIRGGGLSARIAKRWVEDLGVSIDKAPSLKVHSVADVEHADMMWEVFEKHAQTDEAQRAVLSTAHECMEIDRAYRGALADAMLAMA